MEPIKPELVVDRYSLFRVIGAGGMASVYLGRQSGSAGFFRYVAIKRLHPQYATNPEFVAMFLDEARLASHVRDRHVVETLDVVESVGRLSCKRAGARPVRSPGASPQAAEPSVPRSLRGNEGARLTRVPPLANLPASICAARRGFARSGRGSAW